MSQDHDDDKIGYGNPPKHSRFKKGQSGNPSGKKKPLSLGKALEAELSKETQVSIGGKKQTLSLQEIVIAQLVKRAAGGDLNAIKVVMAHGMALGEDEALDDGTLSPHEVELLRDVLNEMGGDQ